MLELLTNPKFLIIIGVMLFLYLGIGYVCIKKRNPLKNAIIAGITTSLLATLPAIYCLGLAITSSGENNFAYAIITGFMIMKIPTLFLIGASIFLIISFIREIIKKPKKLFFKGKMNILVALAFIVMLVFGYKASLYLLNNLTYTKVTESTSSEEIAKIYNSNLAGFYSNRVMYAFAKSSYTPEEILNELKNHESKSVSKEVLDNALFDYDYFAVDFLSDTKNKTILGNLPRPLRILRKDGQFYAFSNRGNMAVNIPINESLSIDGDRELFFDVYTDRLFYVSDDLVHYYDIVNKTDHVLEGEVNKGIKNVSCGSFGCTNDWQIAGVYGNYITLEGGTIAATSQMTTYNIITGQKEASTIMAGYDLSRAYEFWVDGQGYRLIINSKGEMEAGPSPKGPGYTRYSQSQDNVAQLYLEKIDESFDESRSQDEVDKWSEIIFSGGKSISLEEREPIASLKSTSEREDQFSIRNFYKLNSEQAAVEINDKLAVVNFVNQSVEFLNDDSKILTLLSSAVLLAPDPLEYTHDAYCALDTFTDDLSREGYDFVFCLM